MIIQDSHCDDHSQHLEPCVIFHSSGDKNESLYLTIGVKLE